MNRQSALPVPREGAQAACYCAACLAARTTTKDEQLIDRM
jgi:hypothetical protein